MRRSSLLLIAAIAVGSFFAQAASGQFPIRIPIPKIPTKDSSTTPKKPDPQPETSSPASGSTTSSTSVSSAASAPDTEVRGIPIKGARITFSTSPDGSNPKTSFTSSEYIYGKLDLGGKTVYDAFGLKNQTDVPIYYIYYDLKIYKPGEKPYAGNWGGAFNATLVTKADAQKTYWNFDVLPDPARISTLKSMLAEDKDFERKSVAGIYTKWYDAESARRTFPQSGTYIIDVTIWGASYDDWGKSTREMDKYPTASAQFSFQFSGTDGQTLVANAEKANKNLEAAKNASEMLRAMPNWWATARTPADPYLAPARLVPMIKGFISQWNLTYLKHAVYPHTGPLWNIERNSLGIPTFRDLSPYIYIIYRDPGEGNACQYGALYMRRPYAGAGTYGEPFLGGIRDVKHIDCAVVK